jgi:hypothetical protein
MIFDAAGAAVVCGSSEAGGMLHGPHSVQITPAGGGPHLLHRIALEERVSRGTPVATW